MQKRILIPAILASNKKQLADQVAMIEDYVEFLQVDYMDGKLVPNQCSFTPNDLYKINPVPKIEAHLMVQHPENIIEDWIQSGVEKFIVHAEAEIDWDLLLTIYNENYIKLYLAINPDTPLNKIEDHIEHIDGATIMTVRPGNTNQQFIPSVLGKIKNLRNRYPKLNIQVDGGLHLKPTNTVEQVLISGANEIVCGSEIFLSNDPIKKIEELEYLISNFDE